VNDHNQNRSAYLPPDATRLRLHAPLGDFVFDADTPAEAAAMNKALIEEGFQSQVVHAAHAATDVDAELPPGIPPAWSPERQAAFGALVKDWRTAKSFTVGLFGGVPARSLWLIGWACLRLAIRSAVGR
jgi:hypothetical protein